MKYPRAWVEAGTKKPVKAKFDIGKEIESGICPLTGKQMELMVANGHKVWCNYTDRIVLPVKD